MDRDSGHFPQWNISGGVHTKPALLQKLGPRGAESSFEPGTLWLYLGAYQPVEWCRMWSTWTHCLQTIELNTINLARLRHIFVFLFHQYKQADILVFYISQYCVKRYILPIYYRIFLPSRLRVQMWVYLSMELFLPESKPSLGYCAKYLEGVNGLEQKHSL